MVNMVPAKTAARTFMREIGSIQAVVGRGRSLLYPENGKLPDNTATTNARFAARICTSALITAAQQNATTSGCPSNGECRD